MAKPLLLVMIVAVALWFMQDHSKHPAEPKATATAPTMAATTPPSVSTPSPSVPAPSPSSTPDNAEVPASSTVDEGEHEGDVVDPTAAAVPRDATQRARFATYEQAAVDFLTVFARPAAGVTREQWWSKVSPHLDEVAVDAYEGTDPATVPFTTVTGPAVILPTDAPADLLMLARVPTDVGFYRVEMTTSPDGIRISRVTPEGAGQ
ncbi:hypothetical protein [Xylanimonas cellulosilytica]|uniref:hypothetical protein n=1 Tax=Xylanimonas cellulosilytica TaxID=186189 RepID=UPI001650E427|nr:hypothetical protein [Xylanimonas cellulosilytica]